MIPVKPYYPIRDDQPDSEELSNELDDSGFYGRPSKSQVKRDMEALQKIGTQLAALSADQLKKIDMPDALRDALREAQRLTPRSEGMRRQLQFIGKIMRKVDPAPLQAALDRIAGLSAMENARMHQRERLRERFIADEAVLSEIAEKFPQADFQQLRQLRRNAIREAELNKPPKSFREIYRVLRELESGPETHGTPDTEDDQA